MPVEGKHQLIDSTVRGGPLHVGVFSEPESVREMVDREAAPSLESGDLAVLVIADADTATELAIDPDAGRTRAGLVVLNQLLDSQLLDDADVDLVASVARYAITEEPDAQE